MHCNHFQCLLFDFPEGSLNFQCSSMILSLMTFLLLPTIVFLSIATNTKCHLNSM